LILVAFDFGDAPAFDWLPFCPDYLPLALLILLALSSYIAFLAAKGSCIFSTPSLSYSTANLIDFLPSLGLGLELLLFFFFLDLDFKMLGLLSIEIISCEGFSVTSTYSSPKDTVFTWSYIESILSPSVSF